MRYYEKSLPDVDEVVMCQVRQIAEMGAYVKLLEYDQAEGMILLSELSRRRIRSIQKLIRVGRNEVVVVLRVDKEKGELIAVEEQEARAVKALEATRLQAILIQTPILSLSGSQATSTCPSVVYHPKMS